jgi:drug/metabolite transporter (DMT)-like permease
MLPARSLTAVAVLCLGVLVFSLQDVVVKLVSGRYPVHEAIAIRCAVALPILTFMVHMQGGLRAILSRRSGWLALRGAILMVSYTTYYLAFPIMPLAEVVALFFAAPLFVTAMAGLLLGEQIGLKRWLASLAGFAGVVVMVQPQNGMFDIALLLPIVSAATYAGAQIMARHFGKTESAPVMSFYQNMIYFIGAMTLAALFGQGGGVDETHKSLAFLLRPWAMPSSYDLLMLAACGPIAAVGMTLLTQAYRMAEANLVASFEYTGLIWGTIWGYAVWGEEPSLPMALGAVLIVGAGLYLLFGARGQPVPLDNLP